MKWLCKCECGNTTSVVGSKLRSGHTKSCGCLRSNEVACGYSKTRLYNIWTGMKKRCYNPNHDNYKWYGAKGITICDEWLNSFICFKEWADSSGYNDNLSIDRIDGNDQYKPSNCQWVSQKEQMNNISSSHIIHYCGVSYTMKEFSEVFNLKYHTVVNRLKLGWDLDRLIHTPEVIGGEYGK